MSNEMTMGIHLVIVDDDRVICKLFGTIANKLGFDVVTFPDGESFLEYASDHRIDVVILDLIMPGQDGFEVITSLKDLQNPPALLVSSGNQKNLLDGAERFAKDWGLNVLGTISKPVDPHDLLEKLTNVRAVLSGQVTPI